jgi:glyoxylase-like metal-dependent hydrolase (beta-lactamase superfamily II)
VQEVAPGLWHWTARHPDWKEGADWEAEVSSYAIDDGERLLLVDPLAPSVLIDELAAGRHPVVVLTCPWHRRDTALLVERLGAEVFVPPPDQGDPDPVAGTVFRAGERLPVGIVALPGMEHNDLVLWIESRRAIAVGDTLIDRGKGLEFPADWAGGEGLEFTADSAGKGVSVDELLAGVRPVLELPVEHVLATHGGPFDRAALESALS